MLPFLQYSLESTICLMVLLLPYLIWFRKTTFYQLNRFYLLGAVFFSLLAPLANIEIETTASNVPKLPETLSFFQEVPELSSPTISDEQLLSNTVITSRTPSEIDTLETGKQTISWNWELYASATYLFVFVVLGSMFFYKLSILGWLIYRGKKTKYPVFTIVDIPDNRVFSFLHYIFLDWHRYGQEEKNALLKHELVHIQQRHSIDMILLEVLQVVFWFNPLYRLYNNFLQQEHEYFVDATTSKEIGQPRYAQILLNLATTKRPVMGHAFAYIPVKHRIFKLFQKPSAAMEKSRFFIALPIVLTLFIVFSCSFDELEETQVKELATNRQVRKVSAFFTNEYRDLKSEQLMMEVDFDKRGAIIKDADNFHSFIWDNRLPKRGFPAYLPYYVNETFKYSQHFVYSNYLDRIDSDFYPKNIQHLIIQDPDFNRLELFLFYENVQDLVALDKDYLNHIVGFQYFNSSINSDIFTTYFAKREEDYGTSTIDTKIEYGKNGLPIHWEKESRFRTNMEALDASEMNHHEKLAYTAKSSRYVFDMKYNEQDMLSRITYSSFSTFESFPGGAQRDSGRSVKEMHLFYNLTGQIQEIDMYNAEKIYLRKYRFHYNEAGYCTKKELINREGSVEFSVRFVYEFYD